MKTRYLVLSAACLVVGAPLAMAQQTTLERGTQNQGQTANQARGQANRSNDDLSNDDQNDNNSDRDNRDQQNDRDRRDRDRGAFLGVAVEPVHPSFSSHVQGRVAEGQGLVVVEVASNSPAERAGLREHDVITTIDDQGCYPPNSPTA